MKRKLVCLLLVLAALMVCTVNTVLADASAAERAMQDLNALGAEGELEPWQQVRKERADEFAQFQEKYAPKVRTLANGVKVQRTPTDRDRVNNKIYSSDQRGCGACHTDLATDLMNMTDTSGSGTFWHTHTDLRNELGIELTYMQCLACHQNSVGGGLTYRLEMTSMMHNIHSEGSLFEQMGGDCWSCHFVDEWTGEFVFWDEVKYDVLHGITSVSNVEGEFSYDQDVVTGDVFTLSQGYEWSLKHWAGMEPDPENDGVYDQYEITVGGEVENPKTYTLRELVEQAPSVTDIGTYACEINGYGGPLIDSFEFTGIPVTWLLEQAVPKEGTNAFKNEYWGGPWTWEYLEDFPCYLVYEINGEPISYLEGYPVMLYCMDGFAGACIKNITQINVIHTENERYLYQKYHGGGGAYLKHDKTATTHHPNVGFCNFTEGMIISADEPYTFEGYAHAYQYGIDAIEFSMDGGETWTRFDTTASQKGKWLYWNFTWTPPAPGAYVLSIRAWAEDGKTWDFPNEKLFNVQ